ncbi:MAG: sugar phosphate isomerase/epimerase family protein [Planctomycetota bacterium]|jgi:sugar phosphate isomerase/epimerase
MIEPKELWNRRQFLSSLAATCTVLFAEPPRGLASANAKRLKLGFDNFSIRAFAWKAPRLIEYASELNVDTLLLSDLDVYESLEDGYLRKVGDQAKRAGIELQAGTGSICPTSSSYNRKKWGEAEDHARLLIRTARRLGSSVARCYLGSRRDREGDGGIYRHIEETVKVLKAVRSEAEDANVKIAVENHAGDMQAWELASLIEAAGTSFVGATIDPGNATWAMEDPAVNLEILGPYVVTAGIRDTAVWETENGAMCMWANMGQGVVDWQAYVKRFRELCPQASFVLEIISYKWSSELTYLKPEFWSNFPRARAHEFARFVALAKRGGKYQIPAARPTGPASKEMEQAQQKFDLEQGLEYCKDHLGLGRK